MASQVQRHGESRGPADDVGQERSLRFPVRAEPPGVCEDRRVGRMHPDCCAGLGADALCQADVVRMAVGDQHGTHVADRVGQPGQGFGELPVVAREAGVYDGDPVTVLHQVEVDHPVAEPAHSLRPWHGQCLGASLVCHGASRWAVEQSGS